MFILRRRLLIQRAPPVNWREVIQAIRRHGFGTSAICFAVNVGRSALWQWECKGSVPNYEDGRALLQLLDTLKT